MWTFELGAEFDFKTLSYLKSYFMDSERLRGMRRENIDPFDQYGITDKNPVGVYTNGPVGIGMRIGTIPIGFDLEQAQSSITLGITVNNRWDGEIIKMKRLIIIMPKGFTLEEIGVPDKREVGCSDLPEAEQAICDDAFNTVYIVNDTKFPKVGEGDFKSYRAFLRVEKDDYEKILGLNPIATKYFKVTAEYTYRMKKKKIIEVKDRQRSVLPGMGGVVVGGDADMTPPNVENFNYEIIEPGKVKVTWETDDDSNDDFRYLELPSGISITTPSESGLSKEHERTLTGLASNKTFQYTIETMDAAGNKGTNQGTFKS
jgi:hypothetical protein